MKKLLLLLFLFLASLQQSNAQQCFANATSFSSCDSSCNGSAYIVFTGAAMPVQLSFNGQPPVTVTSAFQTGGLCAGVYNFIAIDANGDTCTGMNTVTVLPLTPVIFTVSTVNATCTICNDGAASVNITSGTGPFSYLWSNGSTGQTLPNLSPGVYTVTITDANGCSAQDTFTIGIGNTGFYGLIGTVYLDLNQDGIKDAGEPGLPNQIVNTSPGGIASVTDINGMYVSIVVPGTYNVSYQSAPGWNLTSLPVSYDTTISTLNIPDLDFGIYPDSTSGSAYVSIWSNNPRCFWNVYYSPFVYNNGFTPLSGTISFTYDTAQTYISSNVTPASIVGNTLTYNFSNLLPGHSFNIGITLLEPGPGSVVQTNVVVNATDLLGNIIYDSMDLTQTVSCSFDPNDKAVTPSGAGQLNYVAMDSWLTYHIRFQNTGNDTAFKVVILDTLDADLDLSTFAVIGSSHPMVTNISPAREVAFTFDNILLPDSNVNEPGSHGYVTYSIKGLNNNPDPTEATNTAYIYFDLNSPVETNTTLTTFSDNWLGIPGEAYVNAVISAYPNPVTSLLTVQRKASATGTYTVSLRDITGRLVEDIRMLSDIPLTIDCSAIAPGTYLLKAEGTTISWMRIIIQ